METADYIDIGVIAIVALLGLRGLRNGLIHEIMGVLGIVIGIYCASRYFTEAAKYIEMAGLTFENKSVLWTLAFILILAVIWIGFLVLGQIVSRFVIILPEIALVNYCGGYVFAALKYFVILSVCAYALTQIAALEKTIKEVTKGTKSYPMMCAVAEKIINIEIIQELKDKITKETPAKPKKQEIMRNTRNRSIYV